MQALIKIAREIVSLFVDDGSLAAIVLVWLALCGLALPKLVLDSLWQGPILFIGLSLILLESALRGAKGRLKSG
jgi:hypothetical protein